MAYRWRNCLIVEHPNLPGKGTSSEKSFLFHKIAVGFAVDTGGIQSPVGYDNEQDYSYARASCYMGAVVLQNTGIVVITHDGRNRHAWVAARQQSVVLLQHQRSGRRCHRCGHYRRRGFGNACWRSAAWHYRERRHDHGLSVDGRDCVFCGEYGSWRAGFDGRRADCV